MDKEPPSADPQPGHGDMFDNWDAVSGRYGLTRRESEVVLLFAKGRSYARIQEMLFISRGTVNYHMNNAYRKLGISSRQELL
ncbi:MAG: helix-turn-helix transcriptional regulator, partial [Raoultibacter sp.]